MYYNTAITPYYTVLHCIATPYYTILPHRITRYYHTVLQHRNYTVLSHRITINKKILNMNELQSIVLQNK